MPGPEHAGLRPIGPETSKSQDASATNPSTARFALSELGPHDGMFVALTAIGTRCHVRFGDATVVATPDDYPLAPDVSRDWWVRQKNQQPPTHVAVYSTAGAAARVIFTRTS